MKEKKALTLKEKQDILFEILKEVDAFCRANDIKYSISDGTMLGAVRHGGFIPWDDDIDICMLREDFDRFAQTFKSDRYEMLYRTETENAYFRMGFIKINDSNTCRDKTGKHEKYMYGVALDIFPLEEVPEDEKERKKFMHKIRRIDNRLYLSQKTNLFSKIKSIRHNTDGWLKCLETIVHEGKYKGSSLVGQSICVNHDNVVLRRALFDNIVDIPFEGYMVKGFGDTHEYLSKLFGDDYMTPREWAHNEIIYRRES